MRASAEQCLTGAEASCNWLARIGNRGRSRGEDGKEEEEEEGRDDEKEGEGRRAK